MSDSQSQATEVVRGRHVRRKSTPRRKAWDVGDTPISIRVGNRRARDHYYYIQVSDSRDDVKFARMLTDVLRQNPKDPLLISINGYQPWLEDILNSCIDDRWQELPDLNKELQFAESVKFPERSNKRAKMVPWSFIVDEMNVPEVYWWTFDQRLPPDENLSDVDNYRFRLAVWYCGRAAYRYDDRVPVTIVFTQPTEIAEHVVTELMFNRFYNDDEYDLPRRDEEGICWFFLRFYSLLTDWQNIAREIERELEEAELNSRRSTIPVKLRARTMHHQIDRIYELKEYLRFHSRSFKKLVKLKDTMHKATNDNSDPVWDEMDDAIDDLDQYDYYLDTLKERFNNLLELTFNIESANQSDYSRFLSVIAAIYLPLSFLASIFGITTFSAPAIYYLWVAIPLFFITLAFTFLVPWAIRRFQAVFYPVAREHIRLPKRDFTMLGAELPDSADVPRNIKADKKDDEKPHGRRTALRRSRSNRSRTRVRDGDEGD